MATVTGTVYKINGTAFPTQPTSGRWMPREQLAIDGNLQAIYPLYYEFELSWQLTNPAQMNQLQGFFTGMSAIGNIVADLPTYAAATYVPFYAYSGCVVREPQMGVYFNEHHTDIKLLIAKIRV
jgi:hypothetical protein